MSRRRRLTYQPALDGIRALAVIVVILFHAGIAGFGGGYVGVSVFFTLSGFLITSLLISEQLQNQRIDVMGFYARRARRLLPAALLCVVAVVIASATTDWFVDVGDLRTQVVGSLLQVENWVLLAGAGSYQRLFTDGTPSASPLAHFWSLAIEEQFYWIWPLTLWAIFRLSPSQRLSRNTSGNEEPRADHPTLEGNVIVPRRSHSGNGRIRGDRTTADPVERIEGRGDSGVDETGELPIVANPTTGGSARPAGEIWAVTDPIWQRGPDDDRRRARVNPYPIGATLDTDRSVQLPKLPAPKSSPITVPSTGVMANDETGEIPAVVSASPNVTSPEPRTSGRSDLHVGVPRPVATAVVVLTVLAAISAPIIAVVWGADAAYWATPARLAEILVGASAAALLFGRTIDPRWDRAGWLGLAALACCVVLFPISGGPAYAGAMPVVALASAALVVGAQANGWLQRALSLPALVGVGKLSYGAYLYHWPIFVVVNSDRTGWDPSVVFAVRLSLTAAVTVLSYGLIERPVRRPRSLTSPLTLVGGLTATGVAIVLGGILVPANAPYWETSEANAAEVAIRAEQIETGSTTTSFSVVVATAPPSPVPISSGTTPTSAAATPPPSTSVSTSSAPFPPTGSVAPSVPAAESPPTSVDTSAVEPTTTLATIDRPLRVVVAGDSTGGTLAAGLIEWAVDHPETLQIEDLHVGGCGVLTGGDRLFGTWGPVPKGCDRHIQVDVPAAVEALQPDVVMISAAVWDLPDRRWDDVVYTPFDRYFQDRTFFEYTVTANRFLDAGAKSVALIINPVTNTDWQGDAPSDDPDRQEVLDSILLRIAANRPDRVRAVDLRQYVDDNNLGTDRDARPDGVHWTPATSKSIAQNFLVAELFRAASVAPPDAAGLPASSAPEQSTALRADPQDPTTDTVPVASAP